VDGRLAVARERDPRGRHAGALQGAPQRMRDFVRTGPPRLGRARRVEPAFAVRTVERAELGARRQQVEAQAHAQAPRVDRAVDDRFPQGAAVRARAARPQQGQRGCVGHAPRYVVAPCVEERGG
jgi:hypothetical protein